MFCGRKEELATLNELTSKKTASLVCLLGRRRIGKSTLIKQFAKKFDSYFEIQGLAPVPKMKPQMQLDHFAKQLKSHFGGPLMVFKDWEEALEELAKKTSKGRHLILLDEVSWLAWKSPLFPSHLKDVWDRKFKENIEASKKRLVSNIDLTPFKQRELTGSYNQTNINLLNFD
jgi:AAA+ ATPase superfamily predicted ATPase